MKTFRNTKNLVALVLLGLTFANNAHAAKRKRDEEPTIPEKKAKIVTKKRVDEIKGYPTYQDGDCLDKHKPTVQLWNAAQDGNIEQLKQLISQNVNPNVLIDDYGYGIETALMASGRKGQTESVKILLAHPGINITARSIDGECESQIGNHTALDYAVHFFRLDIVKLLANKAQSVLSHEDFMAYIKKALGISQKFSQMRLFSAEKELGLAKTNLPLIIQFLQEALNFSQPKKAFLMGLHPRLGQDSTINTILRKSEIFEHKLIRIIFENAGFSPVNLEEKDVVDADSNNDDDSNDEVSV